MCQLNDSFVEEHGVTQCSALNVKFPPIGSLSEHLVPRYVPFWKAMKHSLEEWSLSRGHESLEHGPEVL